MTKFKQIEDTDFNFLKRPIQKSHYFWGKFITSALCSLFISLVVLAPLHKPLTTLNNKSSLSQQKNVSIYPDYTLTSADKVMLEAIFNYDNLSSVSKDKNIKNFQDGIKKIDLLNGDFDNDKKFTVTSSILSIEPSDKAALVQETGYSGLDYVDIVVQKTYAQNKDTYFEQQIISLALDQHKIVLMKTNRIID